MIRLSVWMCGRRDGFYSEIHKNDEQLNTLCLRLPWTQLKLPTFSFIISLGEYELLVIWKMQGY